MPDKIISNQNERRMKMNFWDRMREVRTDKDENQTDIAEKLGITRQQYQLYESGKRQIKPEQLALFCKYYGVSADYILGLPRGLDWPR